MYIVKLTYNYDWPLFRQTPNSSGIWGNYQFVIDDELKQCDFWIIYSNYAFKDTTVVCNPDNIIFIPAECYNTSPRFSQDFLDQFGMLLTVQRELKHKNIVYMHNANPWFVGKSYDELLQMDIPKKTKLISVISSNKAFTRGHRKRLEFVRKLKLHFGDQIDVFGRGVRDFDDKWEVLADYKYSIAIENDYTNDWVTEKFFDCLYAFTFPIYYGCPNLKNIIADTSFANIDINNLKKSVKIIEDLIESEAYEKSINYIKKERISAINNHNFFPLVVSILDKMDVNALKREVTIKADNQISSIWNLSSIRYKISTLCK